jgi:hypothetical protein
MKTMLLVIGMLCLCAYCAYRTDNAETVQTRKLSNSSVSVECQDEHEPVVQTFENTTHITITCKGN